MRIDSIHLTNYYCHADLQVNFRAGFNVIVGTNGSGKTSLVRAVCDALSGLFYYSGIPSRYQPFLRDLNCAQLNTQVVQGRYRFEPQYPVKATVSGKVFGMECSWVVFKDDAVTTEKWMWEDPNLLSRNERQNPIKDENDKTTLPIIAFYQANRRWNQAQPNAIQAATIRNRLTQRQGARHSRACWRASFAETQRGSWPMKKVSKGTSPALFEILM